MAAAQKEAGKDKAKKAAETPQRKLSLRRCVVLQLFSTAVILIISIIPFFAPCHDQNLVDRLQWFPGVWCVLLLYVPVVVVGLVVVGHPGHLAGYTVLCGVTAVAAAASVVLRVVATMDDCDPASATGRSLQTTRVVHIISSSVGCFFEFVMSATSVVALGLLCCGRHKTAAAGGGNTAAS